MKHAPNIAPNVSRDFTLPLEVYGGELLTFELPDLGGEWQPLPEHFLEGISFTSRFTASGSHYPWWMQTVHVFGGSIIGTNNRAIVEYSAGEGELECALSVKQVRLIKAIGSRPTQVNTPARPTADKYLHFKWQNGSRLALSRLMRPEQRLRKLFSRVAWNEFSAVDENWRAQILGHFSFKPIKDNSGLITIYPERVTGGVFDNRADIELPIKTPTEREVVFEQAHLLSVLKVASEIKFIHEGDHSKLLFKADNVRGFLAARQRVPS
ncbi:MAG: hypothetical protein AAFQ58_23150 [Pseudomonadota bacterium]